MKRNEMTKYQIFLRVFFIFFLIFFLIPIKSIDPNLKPYVNEYYNTVRPLCNEGHYLLQNKINIQFNNLSYKDGSVVGLCFGNGFMYTIWIDKFFWSLMSDSDRYQTIIHELTHCHLGLKHSNDPFDYMYPELNSMSKEVVKNQLIEKAKKNCNKWF